MQICNCCGIEKPISEFEWQKNRPNLRKTCKQCRYTKRDKKKENAVAKERKLQWQRDNKDKLRRRWEKYTYGVCKEELGITECMICGSKERLCIDHCHTTSEVRGILCSKCNSGLGMFRDNTTYLLKAIQYLTKD
jgi:hypothetical protein